jgi:hypothetical protein
MKYKPKTKSVWLKVKSDNGSPKGSRCSGRIRQQSKLKYKKKINN